MYMYNQTVKPDDMFMRLQIRNFDDEITTYFFKRVGYNWHALNPGPNLNPNDYIIQIYMNNEKANFYKSENDPELFLDLLQR